MNVNAYRFFIYLVLLVFGQAHASNVFTHNPELYKLIEKNFPGKKIKFTSQIELPLLNDKQYNFDSPNRLDYYNFTYPFKLKTDLKNIKKFAIFIIPGTDSYNNTNWFKKNLINKEYFIISGNNIEKLDLSTLIQMPTRCMVYLDAQSGIYAYVNYRAFTREKKTGIQNLVGNRLNESIVPVMKWYKLKGSGLTFDHSNLRFKSILKDQVLKIRFLFGSSTSGYHYKYQFLLNKYAEPFPSYIKELSLIGNKKTYYKVNYSPYTSTGRTGFTRLSMNIPNIKQSTIDLNVVWTDNHDFIYKKEQRLENNVKPHKTTATTISNPSSELYLPVRSGKTQLISELLKLGSNPNVTFKNGLTPLALALKHNKLTIIQLLLNNNADANKSFLSGITPLMWAVETKNIKAIKMLLHAGASPVLTDNSGLSAFDRVFYFYKKNHTNFDKAQTINLRIIKHLTKGKQYYSDPSYLRLVMSSIKYDFYNIMRYFVDSGLPPNFGNGIVLQYFIEGMILDYAQKLISRGAKLNLLNQNNLTIYEYMVIRLNKCNDPNSYVYTSTYCVMLIDNFHNIKKLLNRD